MGKQGTDNIKQTKLERYGDENYNNRVKATETSQARFGVASFSQTMLAQHKPKFKAYIADDIWFDSFPELAIYLYYKAHELPIERASLRFEYLFNNESHYYFPDLLLMDR